MPPGGTTLHGCPISSAPASALLQHVPPSNTGRAELSHSQWLLKQEGDGAADDKNHSSGISSSLFPRRKENYQCNTQGSTVYPHFQSWAGPWEAQFPMKHSPRTGHRVLSASYGEQKEVKGVYNHPWKSKI